MLCFGNKISLAEAFSKYEMENFSQINLTKISSPFFSNKSDTCRIFVNEEYSVDEARCQETCDQYGNPFCGGSASDGDCYCKKGYTRITTNGMCVRTDSLSCRMRMPPTAGEWRYFLHENGIGSGTGQKQF